MLQTRILPLLALLVLAISVSLFVADPVGSATAIRRLTNTPEESLSLNPSLSGDGLHVAFESTALLVASDSNEGFHAFLANLSSEPAGFTQIATTRAVAPAISQDGWRVAFSSAEDLVGQNPDRNPEIFLLTGPTLEQVTHTTPSGQATRINDGNFQPSITDNGRLLAFSSNRDLVGLNPDLNFEIFLFDTATHAFTQLTNTRGVLGATDAKLSGDGSHVAFIRDPNMAPSIDRDLVLHDMSDESTRTIIARASHLSLTYGRAISDDGQRVVYSANTAANESQVFLFDATSNSSRQITSLGSRNPDVSLQPTISGDGKRLAFATRRSVVGNSDGSVELFAYDIPTAQFMQLTDAPSRATAEVVASLNDDGSQVAFNFPRVLSGPVLPSDTANNCEIYLATIPPRVAFALAAVFNAASLGNEPALNKPVAPGSIALARGSAFSLESVQPQPLADGSFPTTIDGTRVEVNGRKAQLLYVSPTQISFVLPAETPLGRAEIIITNSDGFQSLSSVNVSPAAPGLFSRSGDGRGAGVIVNADTLTTGPFDPTNDGLRVILFATGVRNATNTFVMIGGRLAMVEAVINSADLPGLDEIHVPVPSDLRGSGVVNLIVEADGQESNAVTINLAGSSVRDIVINEVLVDPPDGLAGDANHDGRRESANDEFVELVNTTTRDLDLRGYQIQTRGSSGATDALRHTFPPGTVLDAGTAIVVFGGGQPDPINPAFAGAQISKASTGSLSLLNSGGVVTLRDSGGALVTFISYGASGGLPGDANQSLTRSPDVVGNLALHKLAAGSADRAFSPGTRVNGASFLPLPTIFQILVSPPSAGLLVGREQSFTARAVDENNQDLRDVIFRWRSSDPSVAVVDANGLAKAISRGRAQIIALARGAESSPSLVVVSEPSPSPSPLPSPSPTASPAVVISEFRTRGPNGANDEFVELYNNSDAPVSIGGWKVRGSNSAGSISTRLTINVGTIIPARRHFLATNSGAYSGSVAGDQAYTNGITNDGGVALTLPDEAVVDQIGLSPGSAFREGMHVAPMSTDASQSYERKPGGPNGSTQDTNDNFSDFQLLTPSDPQNLASNPTPGPSPSPSPSPTATPLPSPSPSPSPTPSPIPSPSPSPSPSLSPSPSPAPSPSPSPSPSPAMSVVISQIYGGGGNNGAPFRNDFIEIFNSGNTAVNLAGWSVQYASATGASWSVTNLVAASLSPGQYYLIQESSGGSSGASLPTPDATGTIAMAATAGKVALVSSTTPLTGACPVNSSIVDLAGYGTSANCFEGTGPTIAPTNTTSVLRNNNGCTDTQNNAADFLTGTPTPRNTATTFNPCAALGMLLYSRGLVGEGLVFFFAAFV